MVTDNYTRDVLARLNDFVGPGAQWQRRLWDIGLVVALRELREASDAVHLGALNKHSVKWLALSIERRVARDPGAGEGQALGRLRTLLKEDLASGGSNYHELVSWTDDIEAEYLPRWRARSALPHPPGREQVARALATHLIGEGFSAAFLRERFRRLETIESLNSTSLVAEAMELAETRGREFEALLLFDKPPPKRFTRPGSWQSAAQVRQWLADNGFDAVRQHGGLLLEIDARDPYRAAELAGDIADRLQARAAVGSRNALNINGEAFVAGHPDPLPWLTSRRAEVRALEREDALLRIDQSGPLDQSLELLSHLNTSSDAVAAAAGWSAVESLLSGPGDEDKVVTADRLANLVACSWPRAELTTIAWARVYQGEGGPDPLAAYLRGLPTNRERADRVLHAVVEGENLGLNRPSEILALKRMERFARAPRQQLLAVRDRAAVSLRRLYRQRNLVVHGGQTAGFNLSLALKLAAPLVGAGLDRLTHASLVDGDQPLELAARARMRIHRAGTSGAVPLTALLE